MLVRYQTDDQGVAWLTLDDPDTRNALGDTMLDDLLAGFERARADDAVRAVVLGSSHERVFSSGGDLKAFAGERTPVERYGGLDRFPRLFTAISGLGKPVLCAAGGDVLAGAFGLALACDLVIAREGVRFGCPEINVGTFPFMISALIYRNVPRMRANQLMMLGDLVDAKEAEQAQLEGDQAEHVPGTGDGEPDTVAPAMSWPRGGRGRPPAVAGHAAGPEVLGDGEVSFDELPERWARRPRASTPGGMSRGPEEPP